MRDFEEREWRGILVRSELESDEGLTDRGLGGVGVREQGRPIRHGGIYLSTGGALNEAEKFLISDPLNFSGQIRLKHSDSA